MSAFILILIVIVSTCDSLSIGVKQNVTKRQTDVNFFPDWVPFKNKHGDELGEFIDVAKAKPKKRLAPPVNFIMRAVADSESDDYYDKGIGGGDSDDYYEKKEWSDQNRPGQKVDSVKLDNNTDISDIEGIVNIITKPSDSPILKALKQGRKHSRRNNDKPKRENEEEYVVKKDSEDSVREVNENKDPIIDLKNDNEDIDPESRPKNDDTLQEKNIEKNDEDVEDKDEDDEKVENEVKSKNDNENEEVTKENKENSKTSDDNDSADYDETTTEIEKNEREKNEAEKQEKQRENDAKKAKILNSVDELKQRHAEEQRSISEKIKEEEMFEEELERELERTGTKRNSDDKYAHPGSNWKKITKDYDEFEDREPSFKDKYKINNIKTTTTTTTTTTTPTTTSRKTIKQRQKSKKIEGDGKFSVFRNPNLYTVNVDEDYLTTTTKPKKSKIRKPERFSSRYSAQANRDDDDNVRISLVPVDAESKEGEPTLFFPKMRKNNRKFKIKTTTPVPDTAADSSEEIINGLNSKTASRTQSYTESSPSASDAFSSASNTAPSAETGPEDIAPSASDVSDAAHASTEKKEKKKDENYHRETGGEKEHYSEHDEVHEEHGKKAYEGVHKDTKVKKGHHDKEDHLDKYDDHGGIDKHHHKEDDHYGSHHHEEHGKKHAKYEESGKHSKGHSTKGSHDIHKKDEYEKKVEFFEEEGDMDDEEHDGGYHKDREHSSGGHFKKANLQAAHEGFNKGETGHFNKGGHVHFHKGQKSSGGHDSHHKNGNSHFKAEGRDHGKKWVYHHGHPAKTANLVIIDRRADAYQHGPQYFG